MTAVFDNICMQFSTKFDKIFCRMLEKNVECRHLLAKNDVKKYCRASTIFSDNIFRQSSTEFDNFFVKLCRNLFYAGEIYWQKMLSKITDKKYYLKMLSDFNSTAFLDKFLQ